MNTHTTTSTQKKQITKKVNIRYMTLTAMFSALAFILMFFEVSIPVIIPSFIKLDFSELPALIGSFAMGPFYGVAICLIKNLLHLLITSTAGAGELSNFILGAVFVFPAGFIYQKNKTKKSAICGAVIGVLLMSFISIFSNYYIAYPVYSAFIPMDTIIDMYQAILPSIEDGNLFQCILIFNTPFTCAKGLLVTGITILVYKHLSPVIKGTA